MAENVLQGQIINRKTKGKVDITFLSLVIILLTIGLIMLFSAGAVFAKENYGDSYRFIKKQMVFAVIGLAAMYVISHFNYNLLSRYAWIIYGISILFLILVLMLPAAKEDYGFKRQIIIGPVNFQPSELAKFGISVLFAALIAKNIHRMEEFKFGILYFAALLLPVCFLVVLEPHLSATILIFTIGIILMIIGGIKTKYIFGGVTAGVVLATGVVVSGLVKYAGDRFDAWLDPWKYPTTLGYQVIQSFYAIASGGLFGTGLGESTQKNLWIPEPQNDFIFAVVCEELGLINAVIILALFALLVWRGFVIAMRAKDKFGSLLAIALTFQVGMQTILNIFVATGTIPNTGISLPFFSAGGSSLVMLLAQMGIVLNISRRSNIDK